MIERFKLFSRSVVHGFTHLVSYVLRNSIGYAHLMAYVRRNNIGYTPTSTKNIQASTS